MANNNFLVDLLSFKLLIFRLIINDFGTLKMHRMCTIFFNFPGGACHTCHNTSLQGCICALSS